MSGKRLILAVGGNVTDQGGTSIPERFDVAVSFAGSQRPIAEQLATIVSDAAFEVFYDHFFAAELWGKDLPAFFDQIYRERARFCVIFVSREYAEGMWTQHERQSAIARGIMSKGEDYLLPIHVDGSALSGVSPTLGHVSLDNYSIQQVADLLVAKLRGRKVELDTDPSEDQPGPGFWQSFTGPPNALAYTVIAVGALPEGSEPLDDRVFDAVESWVDGIEPEALPGETEIPTLGWWMVDRGDGASAWSAWLRPGPALAVNKAMSTEPLDSGSTVSIIDLVRYWRDLFDSVRTLFGMLGVERMCVGVMLNTYPASKSPITTLVSAASLVPIREPGPVR
jgi:TIR domain